MTEQQTSTEILRSVPLLRGMTDRSVTSISDLARPATFDDGAVLVGQGDPGDSFIVITSGSATVEQHGREIRSLGPGDFLGEISLIDGGPRTATVRATSPIEAIVIDREDFAKLMSDYPVVRLDLVSALTERLRTRAPEISD